MDVAPIQSERLELISMTPEFMEAVLAGDLSRAGELIGVTIPPDWPEEAERNLRLRLDQLRRNPALQPWLLRAIVLRGAERQFVGRINFHGAPDAGGVVEIGYTVVPEHRGHGYATEATRAMFGWAQGTHGIQHFRASVSPHNAPSMAVVKKLGFVQTGVQWDEEDGEELVFELTT
ncbi:MAG TPA: GNAT family N-acetyltransferase [Dehalococcoidia bacterium]